MPATLRRSPRAGRRRQTGKEPPISPRRQLGQGAALLAVLLVALVLRLPVYDDEGNYFKHFTDEATYFSTAYNGYLNGTDYPLPNSGSGLPLALEQVLVLAGVHAGAHVPSTRENATYRLDDRQLGAGRLAYAVILGSGLLLVLATYALARELLVDPAWALLPAAVVAVSPFAATSGMWFLSDPPFAALVLLATWCVLRARRRIAWLYAAAVLAALSHVLRVNGLAVFAALGVLAYLLLRDPTRTRSPAGWHVAGYAATFTAAVAPYLAFRASYLPGPFDSGVNDRFWADGSLFNFQDHYWQTYRPGQGGQKETMGDYFSHHNLLDALVRLWQSAWLPFRDSVSLSLLPQTTKVLSLPETLAGAAAFSYGLSRRLIDRTLGLVVLLLFLATWLPTLWMYPIVRNPAIGNARFFLLWGPLVAIVAADVLRRSPRRVGLPLAAGLTVATLGYTLVAEHPSAAMVAHWASRGGWVLWWSLWPVLAWLAIRARPLTRAWKGIRTRTPDA
ncbi:MAG: phospholipid carrier-dependent glycosyltransferase [Thermoplasmatota archaeon]